MQQIFTLICVIYLCTRIFRFEAWLSRYRQNIKFSQSCPKFYIFKKIGIFKVKTNCLYHINFYGQEHVRNLLFHFCQLWAVNKFLNSLHCFFFFLFVCFVLFCFCFVLFVCLFVFSTGLVKTNKLPLNKFTKCLCFRKNAERIKKKKKKKRKKEKENNV